MPIHNRIPHDIDVLCSASPESAVRLRLPRAARGEVARVEMIARSAGSLHVRHDGADLDVPLASQSWGSIRGLPDPVAGTWHVVSAIVAAAALTSLRGARDLLVPGDQVRDPSGRVVGCTGLVPARDAMPHLARGAKVWICYTVAELRALGVPAWVLALAADGIAQLETQLAPDDRLVDRERPLHLGVESDEAATWAVVRRLYEAHFGAVTLRSPRVGATEHDLVEVTQALLLRPREVEIATLG